MSDIHGLRPFTTFRFLVEIDGEGIKGAFSGFSGIKMNNQMVQARVGNDYVGVKDNYPGITEYQHVTLTKGVIGESDFLDWLFESTFPSPAGAGTISTPGGSNPYRNLRIVALNERMEEGIVWTLINAIPAGYQLAPLDASRSEVMVEEIEFAFAGVTRSVMRSAGWM